jgi:hypothetical protein
MGRHGLQWLSGEGGRSLLDWVWLAAGFTLLAGLVMRLSSGFVGTHEFRFAGMAVLAVGIVLAVLGWIGEKVAHDTERR